MLGHVERRGYRTRVLHLSEERGFGLALRISRALGSHPSYIGLGAALGGAAIATHARRLRETGLHDAAPELTTRTFEAHQAWCAR